VTKRNNVALIEDEVIVFIVGNTLQILNLRDRSEHRVIHGHSTGIGAFAIERSANKECHLAIGEIGAMPNIYIYSYPELSEERQTVTLCNGTQRRYNDVQFNLDGQYLASMGGAPDHMLTIWDWRAGAVILRAKAFSQDVFSVRFSPFHRHRLISAGTGHIRFWQMAQTFTGLKLQGKIGKFGAVDLSDVASFVEFASGKILSGSEHGNLLMWHSHFIQFVARPDAESTCHAANIIYVDVYQPGDQQDEEVLLVSASTDGCIKFWHAADIEFFEPSDDCTFYPIRLKHEMRVSESAHCKLVSMVKHNNLYWLIQDAMGNLWKLQKLADSDDFKLHSVQSFHGLYVTAIECGRKSHEMTTAGKDGTIRHWNLQTKTCDFIKCLPSAVNVLLSMPLNTEKYLMAFCDDGVLRVMEKGTDAFVMKYALRLHDEAIIDAAISNDCRYLATITQKQLFFSHIECTEQGEEISVHPIGFTVLPHRLSKIHWSMDSRTLYSYHKQEIIAYHPPEPNQFDTSASFEIPLVATNIAFTPFLTEQDFKECQPETKEEAAENKPETATPTTQSDDVDEEQNESGTEENEEESTQQPKENMFDKVDWQISCILPFYENNTDLLICVQCGEEEAFSIPNFYQWKVSEKRIVNYLPTHLQEDCINNLCYSPCKQFLLLSTQSSLLQVRDANEQQHFVNIRIHSSWQNTPNLVSMTFDDRMLISSSTDGSLFCHLFDPNKLRHPSMAENFEFDYISLEDNTETEMRSLADKCDAKDMGKDDYSVQGEKIQRELDSAECAAETYKAQLRRELDEIRKKKQDIVSKTKQFMAHNLGLGVADFDIDTNLRTKMAQQLDQAKTQIGREMAWNSEKIKLGLSKLEEAFSNTVSVENIEVSSFGGSHSVSTFRAAVLPEWVQRDIRKVHDIINVESEKARMSELNSGRAVNLALTHDAEKGDDDGNKENVSVASPTAATLTQSRKAKEFAPLSACKQKKMVRERLKTALEDMQKEKPDANADDPRDVEAIHSAHKNVGDYKLKSDANYVVPEQQHISASQKRKQMVLLLESVNYIKLGLNERVLALRDLKKRIVENISNDTVRINEINRELNQIHRRCGSVSVEQETAINIRAPSIKQDKEWPKQHRYQYSQSDLIEFERILKQEAEEKSGTANAFGGGSKDDKSARHNVQKPASNATKSDGASRQQREKTYQDRLDEIEIGELEQWHLCTRRRELEYEKKVLLDKMHSTMHTFDGAVSELREEKYKLQNDLKFTDLKFLTLLKELSVLSNFEDREVELNGKLLKCRTEKAQVVVDLTECQERLTSKLEEIRLWQEKDTKIMREFDNIVGERNPFYDDLKRIFKRKIKKRLKKGADGKAGGNADGAHNNEEDDDFDSDSSYDSSSDEDGSDDSNRQRNGGSKDVDDSCPKDCDNLVYEKVMELREKRLDQEEVLVEFERTVDELKKQNMTLINKEKQIDKNLSSTEKEIELFQTEKQQFLNRIVITVPLLLSQIRVTMKEKKLPSVIDGLLIFELKSLHNLQQRIVQQKQEKAEIKKDYTELKKLHKSLTKKINLKQANIDVEKEKCEQVQLLKYGRLVSLEVLDLNNQVNPDTVLLRQKLEKVSKEYQRKLNVWTHRVNDTKNELCRLIEENTKNISAMTSLKSVQNELVCELDKILDIEVVKDSAPSEQRRNRELQKLVQVAKTQANEIDVLKAEIHMLQRKGGMLYAVPDV